MGRLRFFGQEEVDIQLRHRAQKFAAAPPRSRRFSKTSASNNISTIRRRLTGGRTLRVRCAKCGAENPEGLKFCEQCAAPFKQLCAKCGFENSPAARFCGECAAPLKSSPGAASPLRPIARAQLPESISQSTADHASAELDGERKTVTALFADIKGSTELQQDLDPEQARAVIDPALKIMIDAARHYDGYVQNTGDGIFALFGAPAAHEDHPQRAIHAALRMQQEIRRYGDRLVQGGGAPIEIRVGVNTGEVVMRPLKTGDSHVEYAPIG